MIPGVQRQFRVEDTAFDRELLKEQLEAITPVDVVDEQDALALDELEFQDDVGQQELVDLRTPERQTDQVCHFAPVGCYLPDRVLSEVRGLILVLLKFQDDLTSYGQHILGLNPGDTHWTSQRETFQRLDIFRHRRAHEEGLEQFWQITTAEDLPDILIMPIREDKIRFVYHERFERSQRQGLRKNESKSHAPTQFDMPSTEAKRVRGRESQ